MRRGRTDALPFAGAVAATIAAACCAGLPPLGAVLGGLTVAGVLGVAGGVLVALALMAAAALGLRARRRRERGSPGPRPRQ